MSIEKLSLNYTQTFFININLWVLPELQAYLCRLYFTCTSPKTMFFKRLPFLSVRASAGRAAPRLVF